MLGFFVFFIIFGYALSIWLNDPSILLIAVIVSVVQAFVSYFYSDKITLMTVRAREAKREEYLELHRLAENLSIAAGLPKPKIYVINDASPNAFATGRDPKNACLVVSRGLLDKLNKVELEGVVSHELAHIGNYDIRLMTIVVVLVGAIALASDWSLRMRFWGSDDDNNSSGIWILLGIALAILAPLSATLVQLAISRRREYLADATGALITRYPEGLASALEKISADKSATHLQNRAVSHLFIADPYKADRTKQVQQSWLQTVFSTHPPVAVRVARLRAMINNG
ncbi:MAG: hypothetical protein BWY43_00663 [candidate division WS2 bacterium ADurb.Bin280]|uniref:Protease HtpX homolog n=1 Tax=candidate division WS2 bacterium ADurb.Bin280 TaxID=1852829 RepID=A0A1V5SC21_9BACT|nr:MAG: hypothetical protein BWY43_00663 [candidate division WS2 bacterium ADurb.Bin280]